MWADCSQGRGRHRSGHDDQPFAPKWRHKHPSTTKVDPTDVTVTTLGTWMTYAEMCELLGETRHTLNKWRKRTDLDFPTALRKPNGQLLFRRADVAAFIASFEVAA